MVWYEGLCFAGDFYEKVNIEQFNSGGNQFKKKFNSSIIVEMENSSESDVDENLIDKKKRAIEAMFYINSYRWEYSTRSIET